jgi:hypothetical protein
MPGSWLGDLLSWYLEQNGVGGGQGGPIVVVVLPGTSFDSNGTPPANDLVFEVLTGNNEHILYSEARGRCMALGGELDMAPPMTAYTGHMGTLFGAGSDINYSFSTFRWSLLAYFGAVAPGYNVPYWNGAANTSEMTGDIRWNWVNYLGSGENGFTINMDFLHNGLRYAVVVNNTMIGHPVYMNGYGWVFPANGSYVLVRYSPTATPWRDQYLGNGSP